MIDRMERRRKELKVEELVQFILRILRPAYSGHLSREPHFRHRPLDLPLHDEGLLRGRQTTKRPLNENMDSSLFDETLWRSRLTVKRMIRCCSACHADNHGRVPCRRCESRRTARCLSSRKPGKPLPVRLMAEYIRFIQDGPKSSGPSVGVVTQEIQDIIG